MSNKTRSIMNIEAIIVKTHALKRTYQTPHFFILNKGLNSGKPLENPCPNCFVLEAATTQELDKYYWFAYMLWQSKFWYQFHIGSVIPFIRIGDFKKNLFVRFSNLKTSEEQHQRNLHALKHLQDREKLLRRNLKAVDDIRTAILRQYALA